MVAAEIVCGLVAFKVATPRLVRAPLVVSVFVKVHKSPRGGLRVLLTVEPTQSESTRHLLFFFRTADTIREDRIYRVRLGD